MPSLSSLYRFWGSSNAGWLDLEPQDHQDYFPAIFPNHVNVGELLKKSLLLTLPSCKMTGDELIYKSQFQTLSDTECVQQVLTPIIVISLAPRGDLKR